MPDDEDIIASVSGALLSLTEQWNWEKFGAIEPDEIASSMAQMVEDYLGAECMPVGSILQFAGVAVPDRFLLCDGSTVAQIDYPDLFAIVGNIYGAAPAGQFRLPDIRGRAVVGSGSGSGLTPRVLAATWGNEQKTLTAGNHAPHTHTTHSHLEGLAVAPGELPVSIPGIIPQNSGSQGSATPFDLSQPSIALPCIIRAKK